MKAPAAPVRMMARKARTRAPTDGTALRASEDAAVVGTSVVGLERWGETGSDIAANGTGPTRRGAPRGPFAPRTVAPVKPLIVLPTYNEAENIVEVLDRIREAVPEADVLVVDDGSPDGTGDLAEDWGRRHAGGLSVLRRASKSGLGSAYRAGFAQGLALGYDALIEMDSDLQHDPAALPSLISAVDNGADLAIGSRYVPGGAIPDWPKYREYLSRGGSLYARLLLGLQVRDATAGFRC